MSLRLIYIFATSIIILAVTNESHTAFGFLPTRQQKITDTLLCATTKGPGNVHRPKNEFSRPYKAERILRQKNDYILSISADEEERSRLTKRFNLSNITKLEADMSLRRERSRNQRGSANNAPGVQVEGKIKATVTQTCVRTNENFDVDLEQKVFAVVRPVESVDDSNMWSLVGADEENDNRAGGGRTNREASQYTTNNDSNKKKRRNQKQLMIGGRNVNELDVMELQKMLQDFDVEDDVIEDEAIYTIGSGILDVGELVSQLLSLKLDPYPKKPGTERIRMSFSSSDFNL